MITAGCDIGSRTAKAVVMNGERILGEAVIRATSSPEETAKKVMDLAMESAGVEAGEVACSVGTGYGRKHVPFVSRTESEITCHAKGANWHNPEIRTLVDIGGQDAKAVKIDDSGNVVRYVYNDKCASGTGRFLEVIAEALELSLAELGPLDEQATEELSLSSQCVVFAETEIVSLVNDGCRPADIIRAMHRALAKRAAALARSIQVMPGAAMSGGVAKNTGIVSALEEAMDTELTALSHPQVNGAIGAALLAQTFHEKPK